YIVRDLPGGHLEITVETDGARKQIELDLSDGEHRTGLDVDLDDLVTLTGRVVEKGTTTPVAGVRLMVMSRRGGPRIGRGGAEPSVSDDSGRFTIRNVSRGALTVTGFPAGPDVGYAFVRAERTIDGTGTVDVGDVEIERSARSSGVNTTTFKPAK